MLLCVSASTDLFGVDKDTGRVLVNGSLLGLSDRQFTMDVRASYKSFYAVDLLEGCDCANRSDVRVNILVQAEKPPTIVFKEPSFGSCELAPLFILDVLPGCLPQETVKFGKTGKFATSKYCIVVCLF